MNGAEYMTVTQAIERLGVSKQKMSDWLKDGTLPYVPSPYNKRAKLIRVEDVERLAALPRALKSSALAA